VKEKRINEIKGVIIIAISLIIFASLISFTPYDLSFYTSHPNIPPKNFIRSFGAYFAGLLLFLLGWSSYLLPVVMMFLGVRLFQQDKPDLRPPRLIGFAVLVLSVSALTGIYSFKTASLKFSASGFLGFIISNVVTNYFGSLGGVILFSTLIILSSVLVTDILISTFFIRVGEKFNFLTKTLRQFNANIKLKEGSSIFNRKKDRNVTSLRQPPVIKDSNVQAAKSRVDTGEFSEKQPAKVNIQVKSKSEDHSEERIKTVPIKSGVYNLPTLDLLDSAPSPEARQIKDDLKANAQVLEETLGDFGISVKVTDIERGPVITRYELEPAPGVKLNRIVALGDDIALALKASSVRIVAPIPGKARVGVEVPNSQSTVVTLKELLASSEFQKSSSKLPLSLGKDITGYPVIADLADMPHLLIAGTTGAGKTVCVNSLILSMLFKASPDELKLLMVDPKMVELMPFNGMPHLLCPVLTDAKKAAIALGWVVNEMEERYQLLAKAGARNISAYNEKQPDKIPYIVVIIDEMADLMMVARDQIESAITRLAQLSRAVGIHLIMATQRPSVDVITGVIKANFPARVSFKVASKVDSRTVLDMNGADKLLGKGDMLFLKPGEAKLTRAQGCWVKDKEIERVVEFIKAQAEPVYNENVVKEQQRSGSADTEKDDMYEQAVRVVIESNQASVSILQRRLRLGYTRAARIIDMMEQDGLVGPFEGSKPRRILVDRDEWLKKEVMP